MDGAPKITIHHLENSRSLRILWLLEELELPYTVKEYKRNVDDWMGPKELRAVHPLGTAPVMTIEENGKTVTLPESGAIVEWICSRYGPHMLPSPTDIEDCAQHKLYMHYAEGTLMNPLLQLLYYRIIPPRMPFYMFPIARLICNGVISNVTEPALKKNYTFLENELKKAGGEHFVGGKLTGADIMLSFPIVSLVATAEFQRDYPVLTAWIAKMEERPAYKASIEKGGRIDYKDWLNA